MFHRIYARPFTRINETWNYGYFDATPGEPYKDPAVTGSNKSMNEVDHYYEPWYKNIAIDVVCETTFDYPHPFTSEKAFRPMANKRMFILIDAPGKLKYLHDRGFKTFHPFIDETYDTIQHPAERMTALLKEIDRIASIPLDEIKANMLKYVHILEHNYQQLTVMRQQEREQLENV